MILQKAGCFAIVLEKIPAKLGKKISEALTIPTIGIGAGPYCDGQVLVTQDMLGMIEEFKPRFVRKYMNLAQDMKEAFRRYISDVKENKFPTDDESY